MASDPVAATLYTPLYARAHAAEFVPDAAFEDPVAAELLAGAGADAPPVLRDHSNVAGAIWRAVIFDRLAAQFGLEHPDGVIVSAGIGLCSRRQRVTVPETVTWVGVDVPAVVELRRSVLADDTTALVGASLDDEHWADGIEASNRPVLVLAEGVLMYLDDAGLTRFLATTRDRFGPGTLLVADYFHPRIALSGRHPIVKATGAQFRSGARHGRALAERTPGWTLESEHDVMGLISPVHRAVAATFRTLSGGGRAYAVAVLRANRPG